MKKTMKKTIKKNMKKILILAILFFFPILIFAQNKYAYIDIQKVIDESIYGEVLKQNLRKKFEPKENDLKSIEQKLRQLQTELQSSLIKENVKQKKQLEFESLQRNYTQGSQQFLQEVREAEETQTQIILVDLKKIVEEYGKEKKYDFIFENNISQFILFIKDPPKDITEEIVKIYDSRQKKK